MLKAVFFDAAGTLIYLRRSVGFHYSAVASRFGVSLEPAALDHAFKNAWSAAPLRTDARTVRQDDDKGWWRDLIHHVLLQTLPSEDASTFDEVGYFESVYAYFAQPHIWAVYDDVLPTLSALRTRGLRMGVISNFDRRLYTIFAGLNLHEFFDATLISSEVGSDKPDRRIFEVALTRLGITASDATHVGDDPRKDRGAEAIGLKVFLLERPQRGLRAFLTSLD